MRDPTAPTTVDQKLASKPTWSDPSAQQQLPNGGAHNVTIQSLHDGQQRLEVLLRQVLQSSSPLNSAPMNGQQRVAEPASRKASAERLVPDLVECGREDLAYFVGSTLQADKPRTRRARRSVEEIRACSRHNSLQRGSVDECEPTGDRAALTAQLRWDMAVHDILGALKHKQSAAGARRGATAGDRGGAEVGLSRPAGARPKLAHQATRAFATGRQDSPKDTATRMIRKSEEHSDERKNLDKMASLSAPRAFIVVPGSPLQVGWDRLLAFVTLYAVILVPLGFSILGLQQQLDPAWVTARYWFNAMVDLIFALDIAFHLRLAFEDRHLDTFVTKPRLIAKRYVRRRLPIDLLSTMPLDWIVLAVEGDGSIVRLLRCTKVLRSVRLFQHSEFDVGMKINPSITSLLDLCLQLILAWHWIACIYHYIATTDPYHVDYAAQPQEDSYPGSGSWALPPRLLKSSAVKQYCYSLYWAIIATTQNQLPVGSSVVQLVFTNLVTMSGVFFLAFIVGSATTVLAGLQKQRTEISNQLQSIARFMKNKNLPEQLQRRILSYYRFQYTSLQILDENSLLADLPRTLKLQMEIVMHQEIFLKLPLFRVCAPEEILFVVEALKPSVAMPGESVIKQGEMSLGLFFLLKGAVEVVRDDVLHSVLFAVSAFGESSLLTRDTASATVRALRFCEITVLLREDFDHLAELNPQIVSFLRTSQTNPKDYEDDASFVKKVRAATRRNLQACIHSPLLFALARWWPIAPQRCVGARRTGRSVRTSQCETWLWADGRPAYVGSAWPCPTRTHCSA